MLLVSNLHGLGGCKGGVLVIKKLDRAVVKCT